MTELRKDKQVQQASSGSYNGGLVRDNATLSVTGATPTAIYSIPVALLETVSVRAIVVGMKSDTTAGLAGQIVAGARRAAASNVASLGAASVITVEDSAGAPILSVNANTSTQALEIQVTGVAAETWRFEVHVEYMKCL